MKILIAEDTPVYQTVGQELLRPYGEVDLAEDGVQAVEAFNLAHAESKPYDIVFMDIMMPNMDGHQAVQAIRKKEADMGIPAENEVPVIMLTSLDDAKGIMQAYFRDGCTKYINKPLTQEKLEDVFESVGMPVYTPPSSDA